MSSAFEKILTKQTYSNKILLLLYFPMQLQFFTGLFVTLYQSAVMHDLQAAAGCLEGFHLS